MGHATIRHMVFVTVTYNFTKTYQMTRVTVRHMVFDFICFII